jgi:hypothetical protein
MRSCSRRQGWHWPSRFAWEMAFEAEVRQLAAQDQAKLLACYWRWRDPPGRIFWVIDTTGNRHRLK